MRRRLLAGYREENPQRGAAGMTKTFEGASMKTDCAAVPLGVASIR